MKKNVTETFEAGNALLEKQHLNELLLNSLPHPALLINKHRVVLAANKIVLDGGAKIGGYCWNEFGKSEYLSKENKKRAEKNPHARGIKCTFCLMDESLSSLKPLNDPEVHAFGRIWDTYWVPLDEETFLHYAIDTTKRKKAEEELEVSEEKYKRLAENSPSAVYQFEMTPDGTFSFPYITEKIFDITGVHANDVMKDADSILKMIHPEDRNEFVEKILYSAKNLEEYDAEIRFLRDREERWVSANSVPELKPDGSVLWDGFLFDITERKQAAQALKDTKAFLDNIIQSAPDAIITVGLNDKITTFSPSAEAMFGYKAKDIIGKSVLKLYPKRQRKKRKKWKEKLLKEERLDRIRTKQLKANGKSFDVSLSLALLKDAEDMPIGIVGISHDITKERRAERELKKAYRELKAFDIMKAEFLQNVTHELRTPLTAMLATVRLLKDSIEEERLNQILELNERSTWRLNTLVGDLLDAGSIERGVKELKLEPVDIEDLIQHALDDLQSYAAEREIRVEFKREKGVPNVSVDRESIYRVVTNLFNNAIKFNNDGGLVKVEASAINGFVEVSIEDTGIGLNEEDREKVFERFYQVDGSTKRGYAGTGIGLSLTKKLVEMHGGRIWVESEPKKWTRFTFTLPTEVVG